MNKKMVISKGIKGLAICSLTYLSVGPQLAHAIDVPDAVKPREEGTGRVEETRPSEARRTEQTLKNGERAGKALDGATNAFNHTTDRNAPIAIPGEGGGSGRGRSNAPRKEGMAEQNVNIHQGDFLTLLTGGKDGIDQGTANMLWNEITNVNHYNIGADNVLAMNELIAERRKAGETVDLDSLREIAATVLGDGSGKGATAENTLHKPEAAVLSDLRLLAKDTVGSEMDGYKHDTTGATADAYGALLKQLKISESLTKGADATDKQQAELRLRDFETAIDVYREKGTPAAFNEMHRLGEQLLFAERIAEGKVKYRDEAQQKSAEACRFVRCPCA